jgi:hypothetical protein
MRHDLFISGHYYGLDFHTLFDIFSPTSAIAAEASLRQSFFGCRDATATPK